MTTLYTLKPGTEFVLNKKDTYSPSISGTYIGLSDHSDYGRVRWDNIKYSTNTQYSLIPLHTTVYPK